MDVQLTPAGVRMADEAVAEHVAGEQEMLSSLSARERDQLVRLTRKLLAHLSSPPDPDEGRSGADRS